METTIISFTPDSGYVATFQQQAREQITQQPFQDEGDPWTEIVIGWALVERRGGDVAIGEDWTERRIEAVVLEEYLPVLLSEYLEDRTDTPSANRVIRRVKCTNIEKR